MGTRKIPTRTAKCHERTMYPSGILEGRSVTPGRNAVCSEKRTTLDPYKTPESENKEVTPLQYAVDIKCRSSSPSRTLNWVRVCACRPPMMMPRKSIKQKMFNAWYFRACSFDFLPRIRVSPGITKSPMSAEELACIQVHQKEDSRSTRARMATAEFCRTMRRLES